MEEIWEEINELKSVVEALRGECASIQKYFKYLSDPIEDTNEVVKKYGSTLFHQLKVTNIFKGSEMISSSNIAIPTDKFESSSNNNKDLLPEIEVLEKMKNLIQAKRQNAALRTN